MKQTDYKRRETEQDNIQVVLEFPKEAKNEDKIKREVKETLSYILQEYFSNIQ